MNTLFFEPMIEVKNQKIATVIAVHSEKIEGLTFLDRLQSFEATVLLAVTSIHLIYPSGHRPDEILAQVAAVVSHRVRFNEETRISFFFSLTDACE